VRRGCGRDHRYGSAQLFGVSFALGAFSMAYGLKLKVVAEGWKPTRSSRSFGRRGATNIKGF